MLKYFKIQHENNKNNTTSFNEIVIKDVYPEVKPDEIEDNSSNDDDFNEKDEGKVNSVFKLTRFMLKLKSATLRTKSITWI